MSSEAAFLIERLEFLTTKQIQQLIATTLRHLNECDSNSILWTSEMKYIYTEFKIAFKNSHIINFKHDENCALYNIKGKVEFHFDFIQIHIIINLKCNLDFTCVSKFNFIC